MDNEIDLREIFQVLWRGKYLILAVTAAFALAAVFYIFFMTTPVFRYSALLDLAQYQVKSKEIIALVEQNEMIPEAVKDLVNDPDELVQSAEVNILTDNESVLQIEVEYTDPDICVSSAKQIGLAIIQTVSDYRFKQMNLEKERNEKLLAYLDETAAEYLQSRDEQITDLLDEDPVYKRLLAEKAEYLVKLKLLNFNLKELAEHPPIDTDLWVNGQSETARPVTSNKKIYLAAAVILGLMLSVFIVFIRHYFLVSAPALRNEARS